MKLRYGLLSAVAATLLLTGCGGNKLDVSGYEATPADKAKLEIPDVCRASYENAIPKVAVVEFTNNTTFGKAEITSTQGESTTTGTSVTGTVGVDLGVVSASKSQTDSVSKTVSNSETAKRSADAKVAESVASAVEAQIMELGGAKLYSRADMAKIMQEQKFQQSGMANEETLVELGKLAGVKYLVTGAINNVKQKYVAKMETSNSGDTGNKTLNTLNTLGNLAVIASNIALSGMTVETELNVKIIDVETGEMLFGKNVTGKTSIGDFPNASFDQLVGGLKAASAEALKEADAELSKYFKVKGYITQLKSKDKNRIALVSVGENYGVKEAQEFFVYGFEESEDPMSGKKSCDMTKMPVTLKATDQIQKDKTWTTAEGSVETLKLMQLVERKPVKR
ncbi:MAG: hypothetical protein QG567_1154 [Campylobacterota bacterium]|nr:hypothetical protein [Campylobacterota bacterium]